MLKAFEVSSRAALGQNTFVDVLFSRCQIPIELLAQILISLIQFYRLIAQEIALGNDVAKLCDIALSPLSLSSVCERRYGRLARQVPHSAICDFATEKFILFVPIAAFVLVRQP